MASKKVNYFYLGCKVNHYECLAVIQPFLNHGYEESDEPDADVVIVNTCSVTSVADQKSRQLIRRVRKNNPHSIIVVMGCYSQGHLSDFSDFDVDIILGTSHRYEIYDLVCKYQKDHQRIVLIDENIRQFQYEELGTTTLSENVRAYLKIQDGCDNYCSYCLLPYIRGKSRSREFMDVYLEANYLVKQGFKEIVIAGIDIGSYGKDTKEMTFTQLIERLLQIPGLERLTISSLEASQIDDDFIALFAKYPNLAKHLHIPLQSGSNKILRDMNRRYEVVSYFNKIQRIREIIPDIAITTDVIVAFPTESEEDFNDSLEFIKKCNFMQIHMFPFSLRKGTKAESLTNIVTPEQRKTRSGTLLALSTNNFEAFKNKYVGQEVEVLIEYFDEKKGAYYGHTSNYLPMYIKSDHNIIGQIIKTTYQK